MIKSIHDYENILQILNSQYNINGISMELHRTSGAKVYYIKCPDEKVVLKLYRSIHTQDALQTVEIIDYLSRNGYPAVTIIPTINNKLNMMLDIQGERDCVGILYKFMEGTTSFELWDVSKEGALNIHPCLEDLGGYIGRLHRLMDSYEGHLLLRGKDYYIDRFISLLRRDRYNEERTTELERYGEELWTSIQKLPSGFCHGDLHAGNMIRTSNTGYIILDWDMSAYSHSAIDVSRMCDATDLMCSSKDHMTIQHVCLRRFIKGTVKKDVLAQMKYPRSMILYRFCTMT